MADDVQKALYQFDEICCSIQDPQLQIAISESSSGCSVTETKRDDGTIVFKTTHKNGMLHGPSYGFFSSGGCATERWCFQGLCHGRALDFDPSGMTLSQRGYVHGRLMGPYRRWYPNGTLQLSGAFVDGLPEGLFELYHDDGGIIRTTKFTHGRRDGADIGWTEDGYLLFCEMWKAGDRQRSILEDMMAKGLGIR